MNSEEHILLNCQCLSLTCGMHSAPYCQPWVLAPNLGRQKTNSPITSLAAYLQCEVLLIRLSCVQTALTLVSLRPENSSNYFPQIIPFEATLKSQECIFFREMWLKRQSLGRNGAGKENPEISKWSAVFFSRAHSDAAGKVGPYHGTNRRSFRMQIGWHWYKAKICEPRMQRDVPSQQQTSLLSQEAKSRLGLDRTKLTIK